MMNNVVLTQAAGCGVTGLRAAQRQTKLTGAEMPQPDFWHCGVRLEKYLMLLVAVFHTSKETLTLCDFDSSWVGRYAD